MPSSAESVFECLDKLVSADSLYQGLVESLLGVSLKFDSSRSTSAYNFYLYERVGSQKNTGFVQQVDFRTPLNPGKGAYPFLYLVMQQSDGLNANAVISQYGEPQDLVVPTPQESSGTGISVTYVYNLKQWEVSFGIGPSPKESVLSIALDRRS